VLPEAIAVDGWGRLFVLDRAGGRVLRVSPGGGPPAEWLAFGVGDQGGAFFSNLSRLFSRWGPDLFALDPAAQVVYQFDLQGRLRSQIQLGAGSSEVRLERAQLVDFCLTRSGELLLLDRAGGRLLHFDRYGRFLSDWVTGETRPLRPARMVQSADGRTQVLDPPTASIHPFTRAGIPLSPWRYDEGVQARISGEPLLGLTPWNQLILAGRDLSWLRLYSTEGRLLLDWRSPAPEKRRATDLAAGPDSLLYFCSPERGEVLRYRWVFRDSLRTDGP